MREFTRRELLRAGVGGTTAAILSACARALSDNLTLTPSAAGNRPTMTPAASPASPPGSAEPNPPATTVPRLTREPANTPKPTYPPFEYVSDVAITPIEDFYAYTYHPQPPPTIADYRLRIIGQVKNELNLSLDDLLAMPSVEEMRTLECISNPVGGKLIGNAVWRGVPMHHLLELAGVLSRAIELKFECADGYHTSVPVELAMDAHSFLAYWMNGVTLPPKHGYPLRALWPGRYGQKQPKWITAIELIVKPHLGHWEQQGWSNEAIIVPNSRIDQPKKLDVVQLPIMVSGIAFANRSGVATVDVSTDDGRSWHEAELMRGPSSLAWTEWRHEWVAAEPGSYVLRARVTDGEGRTQRMGTNRLLGGSKPDGTDVQHTVAVTVKRS